MESMLCCFEAHVSKSCRRANGQVIAVVSKQAIQRASKHTSSKYKECLSLYTLALQEHAARQMDVGAEPNWAFFMHMLPYILKTTIRAAQQQSLRPGAQCNAHQ